MLQDPSRLFSPTRSHLSLLDGLDGPDLDFHIGARDLLRTLMGGAT